MQYLHKGFYRLSGIRHKIFIKHANHVQSEYPGSLRSHIHREYNSLNQNKNARTRVRHPLPFLPFLTVREERQWRRRQQPVDSNQVHLLLVG